MKTPQREWKPGDHAWLEENDCFGTRCPVVVEKVCKGGTVHLLDETTGKPRTNHVNNLTPVFRD